MKDWLVVVMDMNNHQEHDIINDTEALEKLYQEHKNDIWVGFNSRHYDQYILKGILCGFDPKKINDAIILEDLPGWRYSSQFRKIPLNNYDVMNNTDRGLKSFEGFMGNSIQESSVPFDINRKLTEEELQETLRYCRHDVEQTIQVFLHRKEDFEAHMGLVRLASEGKTLNLSLIGRTKPQLSAIILGATRQDYDDEFDIDFPDTLQIKKYKHVLDWFNDPDNRRYYDSHGNKTQLETMIAGVPHQIGWGGIHGAVEKYHGKGWFLNMDVASLYPSLMIRYKLGSRSMKDPGKYEQIYHTRLKYKKEKNPLQLPLKLVLNGTYGVLKDPDNPLYDPRQANRICVYGQVLLIDLMEHLENYCQIIQSNTDGILIKLPDGSDEAYEKIDDICYEWECRTGLKLEFDEYEEVYQKDVNNYIVIDSEGHYKSKGAYVKKLNDLDYDLPIVNKALIEYMVHGVPVKHTIFSCNSLKEFQLVSKISNKYSHILYGAMYYTDKETKKVVFTNPGKRLNEKCVRIFASSNLSDGGITKVSKRTGKPEKISNSPERCFLYNGDVNNVEVPEKLDKMWYVTMAEKRLKDFGVMV